MKVACTVWTGGKTGDDRQRFTYQYSFFTDPTVSTLTSGTPSQNADLGGLSFPRCLGVRLHASFLEKYHLIGKQARWTSFEDIGFTKKLDDDFYHEDLISREGWAKYYFKGKYPRDIAYVRLEIVNPQTGMLIRTFYFQFKKSYQTSLDGRYYITDPILGDKIVKNGILIELKKYRTKDGKIVYRRGKTVFKERKIRNVFADQPVEEDVETGAIIRNMVRYSEKPKMIFLVTPPHLMKYAKLILILIKQLVDLNFDKSYMTKSNQKPLYKTRFMLDELGNLQSEGHGISNFATMLSIGLGQEQQFTLILQTLQQLRDVYGDSVDKIVQGNTSNIVFLKSTDDTMLDTLQKMSGVTHKTYIDGKSVQMDHGQVFMQLSNNVTYNVNTTEVPVISYNDMAFISERNSMVFRAGDSPIWNRNETILPMSWRLFKNTIVHPGHDYSLQTIPTLSSALDFDVRKNQPNFEKMLDKRMAQAIVAQDAKDLYKKVYHKDDTEIARLDPDEYADEVMLIINSMVERAGGNINIMGDTVENTEVINAVKQTMNEQNSHQARIYAGGSLSADDLVSMAGQVTHQFHNEIIQAFVNARDAFENDKQNFCYERGNLYGADGTLYIEKINASSDYHKMEDASKSKNTNVFAEGSATDKDMTVINSYRVHDAFYKFLVSPVCQQGWKFAGGRFEQQMANLMNK